MEGFITVFAVIVLGALSVLVFSYLAWKILQHVVYKMSHLIAKGVYDAKNGVISTESKKKGKQPKVDHRLNDSERKIRRDWRISFFVYWISTSLISLALIFVVRALYPNVPLEEAWIEVVGRLIGITILLSVMYFFAYVRYGTKWIGWFVIVSPFGTLADIGRASTRASWMDNPNYIYCLLYILLDPL